jgi:hypothetical protein
MYGDNRELITKTCVVCKKQIVMRVDPEDVQRFNEGMFVQHAFADRNGVPYLTPEERQLWLDEAVCKGCWNHLCPADPLAYN